MSRNLPLLLALLLLMGVVGNSCKTKMSLKLATETGRWKTAVGILEEDYRKTKDLEKKKEIAAQLGHAYIQLSDYGKAETWYEKAVKDGASDPNYYYQYAMVLKNNESYSKAIEQLNAYKTAVPGAPNVDEEIAICIKGKEWKEKAVETRFKVEKEKFLNTQANDYAPVILKEGIVFTSDRAASENANAEGETGATGKEESEWSHQLKPDLFIAINQKGKKGDKLQFPVRFEEGGIINTENSEGIATFGDKDKTMYFTSCNRKHEETGKQDSNCVIMVTYRKGRDWSTPERLPFCRDSSKIQYGQPSLSEDGERLFFSSDMPGGFGGHDIWVCTWVKKSNTWSEPFNLGPTINTDKDEMFPYPKGTDQLYFASSGHIGFGGLDLFVSNGRGNEWSTPENLLPPMNSGGDDFGICFETDAKKVKLFGESGYFSSNRGSRTGTDDIYHFNMQPLTFTVSGYVNIEDNIDKKAPKRRPGVKVTLFNQTDSSEVFVMTDDSGHYEMKLFADCNYQLTPFLKKYELVDNVEDKPTVATFGYKVSTDFRRDMRLVNYPVVIELDILYDVASAEIRPDAALLLDEFALKLKEHYYIEMELSSHTDCRASYEYNMDLSQRRAESAVNYLISKGIERERFIAKGYGESKLKNDCACEGTKGKGLTSECTEEMHQANRRTEIRTLSFDYVPKTAVEETSSEYIDPDILREMERQRLESEEGSDGSTTEDGGEKPATDEAKPKPAGQKPAPGAAKPGQKPPVKKPGQKPPVKK